MWTNHIFYWDKPHFLCGQTTFFMRTSHIFHANKPQFWWRLTGKMWIVMKTALNADSPCLSRMRKNCDFLCLFLTAFLKESVSTMQYETDTESWIFPHATDACVHKNAWPFAHRVPVLNSILNLYHWNSWKVLTRSSLI